MKKIFFILALLFPNTLYSQYNFYYNYIEVCSEESRQILLNLNLGSDNTLNFFGYSRTFTPEEVQNGEHIIWLNDLYGKWNEYYPCAEIKDLVSEASKSSTEKADIDINKPIVIVSSDLGYKNKGIFKTSAGFNRTDILEGKSEGGLLSINSNKIANIGYFRIQPLTSTTKTISNLNLLLLENDIVSNLTTGVFGSGGKFGSYFILHAITFGKLNGYPFQDNSILAGYSNGLFNSRKIILSTNLILSYTYRVKVFNLDYYWEDYVGISPFYNFSFRVTPTFALNISYTVSLRTDKNTWDRWSLLLGGRVLL